MGILHKALKREGIAYYPVPITPTLFATPFIF